MSGRSHRRLRALRRQTIALMFQNPLENLLPELTAAQNVIAAAQSAGREADLDLLGVVGLDGMGDYRVPALSGGQQQRLALCCALAREPKVVLADEPTSQLDDTSAGLVLETLKVLVDRGVPVAVASHDDRLIKLADRVVRMDSVEWILGGWRDGVGGQRDQPVLPAGRGAARGGSRGGAGGVRHDRRTVRFGQERPAVHSVRIRPS
ncbi:hypothetical protein GCM10018954_043510 [Kutzneria kofuensis]